MLKDEVLEIVTNQQEILGATWERKKPEVRPEQMTENEVMEEKGEEGRVWARH